MVVISLIKNSGVKNLGQKFIGQKLRGRNLGVIIFGAENRGKKLRAEISVKKLGVKN